MFRFKHFDNDDDGLNKWYGTPKANNNKIFYIIASLVSIVGIILLLSK